MAIRKQAMFSQRSAVVFSSESCTADDLRRFCEQREWPIIEETSNLEHALTLLRTGVANTLIVRTLDQLATTIIGICGYSHRIWISGAALVCTEQPVDTTTSSGKVLLAVMAALTEVGITENCAVTFRHQCEAVNLSWQDDPVFSFIHETLETYDVRVIR